MRSAVLVRRLAVTRQFSAGVRNSRTGDCGINPSGNYVAQQLAQAADRVGIPAHETLAAALRDVLAHGTDPFFGGRGGSGVVGLGYPAAGWKRISATKDTATFRAPLESGTASLTLTRVGSRWLVSHIEKDC